MSRIAQTSMERKERTKARLAAEREDAEPAPAEPRAEVAEKIPLLVEHLTAARRPLPKAELIAEPFVTETVLRRALAGGAVLSHSTGYYVPPYSAVWVRDRAILDALAEHGELGTVELCRLARTSRQEVRAAQDRSLIERDGPRLPLRIRT